MENIFSLTLDWTWNQVFTAWLFLRHWRQEFHEQNTDKKIQMDKSKSDVVNFKIYPGVMTFFFEKKRFSVHIYMKSAK